MNREEVLEHLCSTVCLIYRSVKDYRQASDGFCDKCMARPGWNFQHQGWTLDYVRYAVAQQLQRDGLKLAEMSTEEEPFAIPDANPLPAPRRYCVYCGEERTGPECNNPDCKGTR